MTHKLFDILIIIIAITFLSLSNAQNDTIKKTRKKINTFRAIIDAPKVGNGFTIGKEEEKKLSPIFDLSKKDKEPLKGFDYYLNLGNSDKSNASKSFMSLKTEVDDDVLVKRNFNGKDTSNSNLESHVDLGSIESSTKFVRIEFADFGLVDGDKIRIYLNQKVVESNITLTGISSFIKLDMEPGYNRIDFSALNQGFVGPNTAAFMVYDDKGKLITAKAWNLEKNQNATLSIIKY